MQTILALDITQDPARLVVAQVDGRHVRELESRSFALSPDFTTDALYPSFAESSSVVEPESPVEENSETVIEVVESLDDDAIARTEMVIPSLHQALEMLSHQWTTSILVVPPVDYLSLHLELPFRDERSINRILALEIQDTVPFEINDFLLQHRVLGERGPAKYDVHSTLIPRRYIEQILIQCRRSNFEPMIITTPASVLPALHDLAPDYFPENCAFVLEDRDSYHLAVLIDGKPAGARQITLGGFKPSAHTGAQPALLTDLKLAISFAERRYGRSLRRVTIVNGIGNIKETQKILGRVTEAVALEELVDGASRNTSLAGLASFYAQDDRIGDLLVNYRTREFSYRPQLNELFSGVRALGPYFAACVVAVVVWAVSVYYLREYRYHELQDVLTRSVQTLMPQANLDEEPEPLSVLANEISQITSQLASLGSLSSVSPLDAMLRLSRDLQLPAETAITKLEISGQRITAEGAAPDYAAVERIEKRLDRKREVYCRVRAQHSGGSGLRRNQRGFTFEIRLCD